MPTNEDPLNEAEFTALMEPFGTDPSRLAVAVSGGPDSMALAILARQWIQRHNGKMIAFIVDHRLRPESSTEAETVKKRLNALAIDTVVLRWKHDAVLSRVHVQARRARYDLLLDACRARGIHDLLVAHQREDQAETILMRFAKGSGLDGLAGMEPIVDINSVRLLRPLLSVPKARLRATCEAANVQFVTDPSNQATKYARGRLRHVQPLLEAEGFTIDRLLDFGARAREANEALDYYAQAFTKSAVTVDSIGIVRIEQAQLRAAPQAIALRILGDCLQCVHSSAYAPERVSLQGLLEALRRDECMPARTLHGCLVSQSKKSVTIMREFSAIADVQLIAPGETVSWDGRWQISASTNLPAGLEVRALGLPPHDAIDRLAPDLRRRVPQGRARAALPALWRGKELALIPSLTEGDQGAAKAWMRV